MTASKQPKKKGGKKKIAGAIKLIIPAGSATPAPPIGPALGQRGINIMEFCKAFNAKTQNMTKGTPLPTVITFYSDKSFDLVIKLPPITFLLKEKTGKKSGSATPGREVLGMISQKQIREVAEEKMPDLNTRDIEAAMRLVEGSARSMGLQVVEG